MRKTATTIGLIGALFFVSCSTNKKLNTQQTLLNEFSDGEISYKDQFKFKSLFLEAQRLEALEEYEKCCALIEQCLTIDPASADAHYEMAQLYLIVGRTEDALFHAQKSHRLNPNNLWALELLAVLYRSSGDYLGEINSYKELIKIKPSNEEYEYLLAEAYSVSGNYKKAISTYNKIEEKIGVNKDLSIIKEKLYISMGDLNAAAGELQKLIEAFPKEVQFQLMLAELYQANNFEEKAIRIYKEILSDNKDNYPANIAMAEHFRIKQDYESGFKHLNVCFDNPEIDLAIINQILNTYFQLTISEEKYAPMFLSLLEKAIKYYPTEGAFQALLGDYYLMINEKKTAYNGYENALNLGVTEFLICYHYLLLGLELQDYDAVSKMGFKSIELHPVQPSLYLFTGIACSMNDKKREALSVLNKGLNYVVNNSALKAEFYSSLGEIYNELYEYKLSDESYEQSLLLDPNNAAVLNNYSYYLSLRSSSLEKAEKLSSRSLELAPNEASYQDTYGWILFKQGRFIESEKWIKKALEGQKKANHIIIEHYGDVLYMLDEKKKAQEYWKKAQDAGGDSEQLIQKAREGILFE